MMLMVPTVTIKVTDRINPGLAPAVVDNVPLGLGVMASFTSQAGASPGFRELIERHCGGIRGGWDNLLAGIPGGPSAPWVPAAEIMDAPMDFDGLKAVGSGPGTAAGIVMDKATDIVRAISRLA